MLKDRQTDIPHYGRGKYSYDIANNYLSERFILNPIITAIQLYTFFLAFQK